jgi:probable HAF family extracellular repeat protein
MHLRQQPLCVLAGVLLVAGAGSASFAGVSLEGLGHPPGRDVSAAYAVSADGSVVVGHSAATTGDTHSEAFRWTRAGGMVSLGGLPGASVSTRSSGVSPDGSAVVGVGDPASGTSEAFRWTAAGGVEGLGFLDGTYRVSWAQAASKGGAVVVGSACSAACGGGREAFRWTASTGMQGMGDLPGGDYYSEAYDITPDASVIVGNSTSASGAEAYRWTEDKGMVGLGDLPGGMFQSVAYAVSSDGRAVVGHGQSDAGTEAFRWTAAQGMIGLGVLSGHSESVALAVSADGSIVVGFSRKLIPVGPLELLGDEGLIWGDGAFICEEEAFIWDATHGMRSLREVLINDYRLDLTGWTLEWANGICDDGLVIVGCGINPEGKAEAWMVTLPEPATLSLLGAALVLQLLSARRRVAPGAIH